MSNSNPCQTIPLDAITTLYDQRCEIYSETWHEALASDYVLWTSPTEGQTVLDLACGTGMVTRRFQQVVGANGVVVGVDVSAGMLEKAHALRGDDEFATFPMYLKADIQDLDAIEALSGTKGTWDVITCCSAITLLPDVEAAIEHWTSWLKRDGRLVVDIPAAGSQSGHLGPEILSVLSSEGLLEWSHDASNSWLGADDRLVRAFQRAGLQINVRHGGSYNERKIFPDEVDEWFENLVGNPFYDIHFLGSDNRNMAKKRFKEIAMSRRKDHEHIHETIHVIVAIGQKV